MKVFTTVLPASPLCRVYLRGVGVFHEKRGQTSSFFESSFRHYGM